MLCIMHVQKVLANAENTKTIDEHLWAVHVWGRMSAENIYNHGDMSCCAPQATDIPTFLILTEILPPSLTISILDLCYIPQFPLKCRAHGTQLRVVVQVKMLMGHGPLAKSLMNLLRTKNRLSSSSLLWRSYVLENLKTRSHFSSLVVRTPHLVVPPPDIDRMNLVQVSTAYPYAHGHMMPPTLAQVATVFIIIQLSLPGTEYIAYYLRQVFINLS